MAAGKLADGDRIVAVNGRSVDGKSQGEVVGMLAGQTRLSFTVARSDVNTVPPHLPAPKMSESLLAHGTSELHDIILTRRSLTEGFGFTVGETLSHPPVLMVHEVLPDSNAAACHLHPGDEIVAIDEAPTASITHESFLSSLSGKLAVNLKVIPHKAHGVTSSLEKSDGGVTILAKMTSLHSVTLKRPDYSIHYGFLLGETDEGMAGN